MAGEWKSCKKCKLESQNKQEKQRNIIDPRELKIIL